MKNKTSNLIAILAAVTIFAACGSPAGNNLDNRAAAEENEGALITQNDGADMKESTQTSKEETESISDYFTDEQLDHIRQSLRIPDDLPVEIEVGTPYYWEGGDMDLVQVDFYHEGEYVAGAAFKPYTEEMARNIYQYSE